MNEEPKSHGLLETKDTRGLFQKGGRGFWAGKKRPASPLIGRKLSASTKAKIKLARAKQISPSGENHWNWKGGISVGDNRIDYIVSIGRKRKASKRGSIGTHNLQQWNALKARFNYFCLSCFRREPEIRLTEDHIIPLARGGSHDISNIQPLCRSCNARKFVSVKILRPDLCLN